MRPVFADPKTDFVFKRIFGSEVHKPRAGPPAARPALELKRVNVPPRPR